MDATAPTLIKTTLDGRAVEVIEGWICLAGQPEADTLVTVEEHPNRQAILASCPLATHIAGRLPLTLAEASVAQAALRRFHDRFDGSAHAVAERLRRAQWQHARGGSAE